MSQSNVEQEAIDHRPKIGYRRIARNTDARSFIGAALPSFPCGDSVFILHVEHGGVDSPLNAIALLNSFVFDWLIRQRLGGTNLNWHVLAEAILPQRPGLRMSNSAHRLNLFPKLFSHVGAIRGANETDALHARERIRLRSTLDALACAAYGCSIADVHHILRDSDLPDNYIVPRSLPSGSLDARGFWRVDRDSSPELRHSVLTLVAFHDLETKIDAAGGDREEGINAFVTQNAGDGWMLPETLRLADYGLGHDDRAKHPQPVASRLGPRFYDWQLLQTAAESRRECHLHARNLLGPRYYSLLPSQTHRPHRHDDSDGTETDAPLKRVAEHGVDYRAEPAPIGGQGELFAKAPFDSRN